MGYDVEFVRVPVTPKTTFPVDARVAAALLAKAEPIGDAQAVKAALLDLKGCRPGPEDTIDYLGTGLSYARFSVTGKAIHVENNCSPRDLLAIYDALRKLCPNLFILDVQSRQLHDADSYREWWSRPL